MRNLLYKVLVSIFVFVLIFAPMASMLKVQVSADAPQWLRLTDDDFANGILGINQIVPISTYGIFFTIYKYAERNLDIYAAAPNGMALISQSLYDDPDNLSIINIGFSDPNFFVALETTHGPKLMTVSMEGGGWVDRTDTLPVGTSAIKYMKALPYGIFAWLQTTSDETTVDVLYGTDLEGWTPIADADTFPEVSFTTYHIVDILFFGAGLVIGFSDGTDSYVYGMPAPGVAQLLGSGLPGITSLVITGEFNLFASAGNFESGVMIYRFAEDGWIPDIDGGFADVTNLDAQLVALGGTDLYAITTNFAEGSQIFKRDESGWSQVSSYVGGAEESISWIGGTLGVEPNYIAIGTSRAGEGPYFANVWLYYPNGGAPQLDFDGDNIPNVTEDAGPNDGDANNDAILDSEQQNVTSFINQVTNHRVVLETDCLSNNTISMAAEDDANTDSAFSYPFGLMHFELACTEGATVTVSQYYYEQQNSALVIARKYNSDTHTYAAIPGAVASTVNIGGTNVLKITYQITDGSPLDQDGTVNGVIVDPAGPAVNSVSVPDTGLGGLRSFI